MKKEIIFSEEANEDASVINVLVLAREIEGENRRATSFHGVCLHNNHTVCLNVQTSNLNTDSRTCYLHAECVGDKINISLVNELDTELEVESHFKMFPCNDK